MPDNVERALAGIERAGIEITPEILEFVRSLTTVTGSELAGAVPGGFNLPGLRNLTMYRYTGGEQLTAQQMAVLIHVNRAALNDPYITPAVDRAILDLGRGGSSTLAGSELADAMSYLPSIFRYGIAGDSGLTNRERSMNTEYQKAVEDADYARQQMVEITNSRPDLTLRDNAFWYQLPESPGVWRKIDDEMIGDLVTAYHANDGQIGFGSFEILDDAGRPTTSRFGEDAGAEGLPELPRELPFIGGIPADYVSNRIIVSDFTSPDQREFEAHQRRLASQSWGADVEPFERHFLGGQPGLAGRPGFTGSYITDHDIEYALPVNEEGDQLDWYGYSGRGADGAYVAQAQLALVNAGFLSATQIAGNNGFWTKAEEDAMASAMREANLEGYGNELFYYLDLRAQTLSEARGAFGDDTSGGGGGGGGVRVPAYQAPDYALLSQSVKQAVRNRLGRDPKDYELQLLADEMNTNFRSQYDAQVTAARSGGGGGNRVSDTEIAQLRLGNTAAGLPADQGLDELLASVGGGGGGGTTVDSVDPYARLGESIDSRFGVEIDRNQAVGEVQQNTRHMMNVLAGLEGAVG